MPMGHNDKTELFLRSQSQLHVFSFVGIFLINIHFRLVKHVGQARID